jgi:hypothetical protein
MPDAFISLQTFWLVFVETQLALGTHLLYKLNGCHDTQHNDIQYNDTQHNIKVIAKLSIMTLNRLCWMLFKMNVANKPIVLNVIMLSVVLLNVMAPLNGWVDWISKLDCQTSLDGRGACQQSRQALSWEHKSEWER